jgi:hypothetical protein
MTVSLRLLLEEAEEDHQIATCGGDHSFEELLVDVLREVRVHNSASGFCRCRAVSPIRIFPNFDLGLSAVTLGDLLVDDRSSEWSSE